jgi:hypothetical protein
MAPAKPRNHVTDSLQAFLAGPDITADLPVLPAEVIEKLEQMFPPRCLERNETAEEHLRYAGKVELVAMLRNRLNDYQQEADLGGQQDEDLVAGHADLASTAQQ